MNNEAAGRRLCCGSRHDGPVCPDGKVMCCVCFGRFSQDDLYRDHGETWDICKECAKTVATECAPRNSSAPGRYSPTLLIAGRIRMRSSRT